ncbi:ABC transporter permease [Candidatus Contubernalis alkaliaceticus]|uniref:ABC transporter permease n=1 Tax=Candidatus Contubernalis alkaliaceticus TaxID=338645 RepID=UPI001F4BFDAE|nr:ABC transporter permease [Candidatus Contubernalis alkalaceticus]UNC91216.1 ABC transporter permease [Candidatus Contubernalis alkalaceticus]
MSLFKKIIKNPMGLFGLCIIIFWMIVAAFAPILAPPADSQNPYSIMRHSFSSLPSSPDEEALFGTTSGGYDIFYGIIWGSRTAFLVGLITVLCSSFIGVLIGGLGAFWGGILDNIAMRIVDLFMSIPFLIAVIVMTTVMGKGLDKIIIALIIFGWRGYARIMRSEVLALKEEEFVLAAKSLGASSSRIFFRHIIPNAIYPIIVLVSINIGRMTLVAAALSFVGVGAEPGFADWGQMLNFARRWISGVPGDPFFYWYTYTYPSIAMVSFVLGWTLFGDALRDIYDPKINI